jgi:hypothetical protein
MKVWYCPSWHGDWRLEAEGKHTLLSIVKPTPAELAQLASLAKPFAEKGWIAQEDKEKLAFGKLTSFPFGRGSIQVNAPLVDVGPVVTAIVQPGPASLTAIRFTDGHIEVCQTAKPKEPDKPTVPAEPTDEAKELAKKKDAEKAATVKRHTPCCPECYVDAIGPATEVLLSFLDEEQHTTWSKERYVVVRGGLSGHRYLLAHRNSPLAARNTRMGYDLDDRLVMHFHDWTVPPEEEVLGAMLILKHREPWLRNEATALGGRPLFKNPFGNGGDGVVDSMWTQRVGETLARLIS